MVTISRSRAAKVQQVRIDTAELSRIVGFTCVAGFIADIAVAAMPVMLKSEQWRMTLLQQIGDRSIILLFGLALLALGYAGKRLWSKRIGLVSYIIGLFLLLSCIAFTKDSLTLQKFTNSTVDNQIAEIQTEFQQRTQSPDRQSQVTPEQIQAATAQLSLQAESYKQNIKTTTVRASLSALSNLLIMGVAFVSLGRYCLRRYIG